MTKLGNWAMCEKGNRTSPKTNSTYPQCLGIIGSGGDCAEPQSTWTVREQPLESSLFELETWIRISVLHLIPFVTMGKLFNFTK